MKLDKIHKRLFLLLILFLPVNLGVHFEILDSYVEGFLVDYLIPTIFLTDILVFFILLTWVLSPTFDFHKILKKNSAINRVVALFIVSVSLSVLSSEVFTVSLYAFIRLILHVGFLYYVFNTIDYKKDFPKIFKLLTLVLLFLVFIGFLQWFKQASVFNNYLVFGEQPYNHYTKGIVFDTVFGRTKIPPYGTFRHPNILGGFISIVLVWLIRYWNKKRYLIVLFVGALFLLLLTLSQVAWLAFALGISFHLLLNLNATFSRPLITLIVVFFILLGLFLPILYNFGSFSASSSVYRRVYLATSSIELIKERPLFGIGLNNSTVLIEKHLPHFTSLRFPQPVHNIFLLVFVESGIFSLLSFIYLLLMSISKVAKSKSSNAQLILVALLQLLIIGSFDHYLFTIVQSQLLFWLTLGFALAYNGLNES